MWRFVRTDFVSKPFDPKALVRCIRRHAGLGHVEAGYTDEASHRPAVAGWPQIEGIDMQEAQLHLSGHVDLFLSTLRRMLNDFMHLDTLPLDVEVLSALATRLHTLKGYAGTLGAKNIHVAAAQAERACLAGQVAPLQPLMQSLAQHLSQLRLDAAAHLDDADAQASSSIVDDLPDSQADDPKKLTDLLRMLKQSDLNAMDEFAVCAPQLRRRLDHAAYVRLCGQIENLEFDDALQTLSGLGL